MKITKRVTVLLACLVAPAVYGLDAERIAPKLPEAGQAGEVIEPQRPETELRPDQDRVLLPELKGLVFVANPASLRAEGRPEQGVHVEGLPMLQGDFVAAMGDYLGKPLTFGAMQNINRDVVRAMRERDYPVVDAIAPSGQDITNGVLQIVVLAAELGQVSAMGGRHFSNEKIAGDFAIAGGDPLRASHLSQELAWANRNPFRSVNLVLAPGDRTGTADVQLLVDERRPLRIYTGVEDSGSELTGDKRGLTGVNWGNAFGLDHQLNYQMVRAEESKRLKGHTLSYIAPLRWRHTLMISGAYITSRPESDRELDIRGRNAELGLRYQIPDLDVAGLNVEFTLGYDYKRSNNNLEFGGMEVYDTSVDVSRFVLGARTGFADPWGGNSLSANWMISPGELGSRNGKEEFSTARAGANPEYQILQLSYRRSTPVRSWLSWDLELSGQLADNALIGSEQFGIGGYRSVRGYDEYVAVGDRGLVMRNELRGPVQEPLKRLGLSFPGESLVPLIFIDAGRVNDKEPLPGDKATRLSSAGLGLRYGVSDRLSLRLDYGWQLRRAPFADERDGRAHFSVVLSY